jgi:hypothetical protein
VKGIRIFNSYRIDCPILFDKIRSVQSNEMLIVTVNRTIALIKCKHPEYNTEINVQYQCNIQTNQWELIYENDNFTCRKLKPLYQKLFIYFIQLIM